MSAADSLAEILIVDDHPLFSEGFGQMVRSLRPGWALRAVGSAGAALASLAALTPDLVIIDIMLPDDDGFGLLATIGARWPGLTAVLISGRDDAAMHVRARGCGAAGFIAKTQTPQAIIEMLDIVLEGGVAFPAARPNSEIPELTTRQAEILTLLAQGHANKEIRHRLGIAERTVRAHLTELFHLLGANSRMQAVIRGRELGLIE